MRLFPILSLLLLLPCGSALGQTATPHAGERIGTTHLALLLGGSRILGEDRSGATWGFDVEYEISDRFGVGTVVEHAGASVDATTILAVVDWHLVPGLVFQFGPGLELEREREVEHGGSEADGVRTRTLRSLVGRVGFFYELEFGARWSVAPSLSLDVTSRHETLVWGVALGRRFRGQDR